MVYLIEGFSKVLVNGVLFNDHCLVKEESVTARENVRVIKSAED